MYIFPAPDGFDLPFDLFSASFFLLSRYEEYLPYIPDQFGRFEADQSLAFRNGFLEEPVIDQWLMFFKKSLRQKFSGLIFPEQKFRFISTFDIDNPWAFRNKGVFRNAAGSLKALWQGRYSDFRQRIAVLRGSMQDPFDNYEYIWSMESKYQFSSVFFFYLEITTAGIRISPGIKKPSKTWFRISGRTIEQAYIHPCDQTNMPGFFRPNTNGIPRFLAYRRQSTANIFWSYVFRKHTAGSVKWE